MSHRIVVFDTNFWISSFFHPNGIPAQATQLALEKYTVSHSPETLAELRDVLCRSKFDQIASFEDRTTFCQSVAASGQIVLPIYRFQVFDDPTDDKFFDLAYAAGAECIVSGDGKHVRPIKHHHGVQIWSPAQFLAYDRQR